MRKTTLILGLIILISAFLRFYQIDKNPRAMYGDSLTGVYDAYSILKTGHDQKGNFLPLVFSLGGGRPGGYIYASAPFVAIFGPNALASRMVSVLSGIGIVILLYLLGKKLLSEKAGLAIAGVAAINPWELSLSRGPFESHFALFLTLLGVYSFSRGFKNNFWFILFGLSFGLASQTYSTYRLTIPLLTALLLFFYLPTSDVGTRFKVMNYLKKPVLFVSIIFILVSTLLSVYSTVSRGSEDRFGIINIFQNQDIRTAISQKIRNERSLDSLPPAISNPLHTPHLELAGIVALNYIQNFLPDFLFLHGDGQVRHNPAEMGGFFWVDILFLIIGLVYLYKSDKKLLAYLFGWILIAPSATGLVGGPHALRSSLLLPPLLILTGIGLSRLLSIKNKFSPVIIALLATLFLIQFVYLVDRFYFVAPQKNARFWSYPAKEAVTLALKNQQKFDYIILSNDIDNMEFAYPAYAKLDPILVIRQNQHPATLGEFKFFKYDNVYIGSLPNTRVAEFIKNLPGSVLYIGSDKEQQFLENYSLIRGFDTLPDLVVTATKVEPEL
ncbi:glycosyltransferase family 39 protein [Candidatus Daviesbacteria bacterium]|nr:glycosyltransferase family 39 protein [Candidatus Daviesbacteria bacterium]